MTSKEEETSLRGKEITGAGTDRVCWSGLFGGPTGDSGWVEGHVEGVEGRVSAVETSF